MHAQSYNIMYIRYYFISKCCASVSKVTLYNMLLYLRPDGMMIVSQAFRYRLILTLLQLILLAAYNYINRYIYIYIIWVRPLARYRTLEVFLTLLDAFSGPELCTGPCAICALKYYCTQYFIVLHRTAS